MKNIFQFLFVVFCLCTTTIPLDAQWIQANGPYSGGSVYSLAVSPDSSGNLFVGTRDGVWRRPLSEMITSVSQSELEAPAMFALKQNYPNPFNPKTVIRYSLTVSSFVTLKVFNMLGQAVTTLVNGFQDAGYQSVEWDGGSFPSGVYFYRLRAHPNDGGQAGSFTDTKKLLLVK